jgi:PAS domain S-box-containing protein
MADRDRSKEELIEELERLRSRVIELEPQVLPSQTDRELQRRYQLLIEMSPDAVIILQDERHEYVNPAFTKIFGYTQDEMEDEFNFLKLIPDQKKAAVRRRYEDRFSGKTALRTYRIDLIAKNGSLVPCETAAERINYQGCPANLVIIRDISERVQAEKELQNAYRQIEKKAEQRTAQWQAAHEKLRESEQQFRILVETMNEGLVVEDAQGKITYVDPKNSELLGCDRDQILGRSPVDFIRTADIPLFQQQSAGRLKQHQGQYELSLRAQDGREIPVIVSIQAILDSDKKFQGSFAVLKDIHNLRQVEEKVDLLTVIVEQSADSVLYTDNEYRIRYTNPACNKLFGWDFEELQGKTPDMFNVDTRAQEIQAEIYATVSLGQEYFGEALNRRKDGSTFQCQMKIFPLYDVSGNIDGYVGIMRDITEKKRAEEIMYRLHSAIGQSAEGVAISDLSGCLQFVNPSFARMHGYEPEELIGKKLSLFHTAEQMLSVNKANEQIRRTGSFAGEIWHVRRDGSVFPGHMQNSLLRDEQGNAIGMIATLLDSSEIKQMEQELSLLREKISLAEKISQVSMLSASLAHELNQPLSVIRLLVQENHDLLRENTDSAGIQENGRKVLEAVSRVTDIIQRYRQYGTRLKAGRSQNIRLGEIAQRIRQVLSQSARMARVEIQVELSKELFLPVGNVEELEQIFFILMQNAIQAADGQVKHTFKILGDQRDDVIILRFEDDCGGIASEIRDKVFEPFYTTKSPDQGTGLGLCILDRIVRNYDGSVEMESRPGQGSTFFVTLPKIMS